MFEPGIIQGRFMGAAELAQVRALLAGAENSGRRGRTGPTGEPCSERQKQKLGIRRRSEALAGQEQKNGILIRASSRLRQSSYGAISMLSATKTEKSVVEKQKLRKLKS